jgi:hypothetical protein
MGLEADETPVAVTPIQPTAVDTLYSEHAGNYLSQEPKLPTPMIEPEKVASYQADEPGRVHGQGNENATTTAEARRSNLRSA